MIRDLAVVGAGAAGAAATYALRDEPVDVTVLEKSRGVCGRAATRRANDCTYDYGANYLKDDDETVVELVTETLPTDGLIDIEEPVYAFDADGEIRSGRSADEHKWTYEAGLSQLAKRLFATTDATMEHSVLVQTLERRSNGWRIYDEDGTDRGTYDAVLLTPPAPQTADILGQSQWNHDDCRNLRKTIASVPYRTVISGVLHYRFELDVPWYGAVNTDKDHDVGWLSREECKDGHVPDGESLLIAQMNETWSIDHYDDHPDKLVDSLLDRVTALVDDERLADPDWTDYQHWRYSQPEGPVDHDTLSCSVDHDLYFAGDWVAGEGRVHAAVRSGLEAGEVIANSS